MPFKFTEAKLPGLVLIDSIKYSDDRGYFMETFKASEFRENGIDSRFVQDSQSASRRRVLRGLHFQIPPREQGKLISVVVGSVFDVAVDIRLNSPTYGKWVGVILSAKNNRMIWIPPGFAHGYMALDDELVLNYKLTEEYSPEHERGIIWNDPDISIKWPLDNPIVSEKDSNLSELRQFESPFTYTE